MSANPANPRAETAHAAGLAPDGAGGPLLLDDIPRTGVSLAGLERFVADLAVATRGAPGGGYVPGVQLRRVPHAHSLVEHRDGESGQLYCNVCGFDPADRVQAAMKRLRAAWLHLKAERPLSPRRRRAALRRLREAQFRLGAAREPRAMHSCRPCEYDECARCHAKTSELAKLPPELTTDAISKLAKAYLYGERRCAFADLLGGDPALVGEATVFLSHAWAMRFEALVSCVREADRDLRARKAGSTPYFWIDLVVNDQFAAPSRPFAWWQTVFRANVERIGHTVVALEWERPIPLQRVWCLWEIFCSTSGSEAGAGDDGAGAGGAAASSSGASAAPRAPTRLELVMPPASRHELEDHADALTEKLCRIDLRRADAYHGGACRSEPGGCPVVTAGGTCPNDKERIFAAISSSGSVDAFTSRVIAGLRDWMVAKIRAALADIVDADECATSGLQQSLAQILYNADRFSEAESVVRETLEAQTRLLGPTHRDTLQTLSELAINLHDQGRIDDAEALSREGLAGLRRLHLKASGKRRAFDDMRTSLHNLAGLLEDRDTPQLAEAEQLYRESLKGFRPISDMDPTSPDPDLLSSICCLARNLHEQGKLGEAERLLRGARTHCMTGLPSSHPIALSCSRKLARVLYTRCAFGEALSLFHEVLAELRRTAGDESEETCSCASWVANTLRELGEDGAAAAVDSEWASALERVSRAKLKRSAAGSGSDSTAAHKAASELAYALVTGGSAASIAEAADLDLWALAGLGRALGPIHPLYCSALRVHGFVLAAQGDAVGAAKALRASLEGLRSAGAPEVDEARNSARKLAAVLRSLGPDAGAAEVEATYLAAPAVAIAKVEE